MAAVLPNPPKMPFFWQNRSKTHSGNECGPIVECPKFRRVTAKGRTVITGSLDLGRKVERNHEWLLTGQFVSQGLLAFLFLSLSLE